MRKSRAIPQQIHRSGQNEILDLGLETTKYAFPSVNDVKLNASDVINLINKEWLRSLVGKEEKVMNWFQQYIRETEQVECSPGNGIFVQIQIDFTNYSFLHNAHATIKCLT